MQLSHAGGSTPLWCTRRSRCNSDEEDLPTNLLMLICCIFAHEKEELPPASWPVPSLWEQIRRCGERSGWWNLLPRLGQWKIAGSCSIPLRSASQPAKITYTDMRPVWACGFLKRHRWLSSLTLSDARPGKNSSNLKSFWTRSDFIFMSLLVQCRYLWSGNLNPNGIFLSWSWKYFHEPYFPRLKQQVYLHQNNQKKSCEKALPACHGCLTEPMLWLQAAPQGFHILLHQHLNQPLDYSWNTSSNGLKRLCYFHLILVTFPDAVLTVGIGIVLDFYKALTCLINRINNLR